MRLALLLLLSFQLDARNADCSSGFARRIFGDSGPLRGIPICKADSLILKLIIRDASFDRSCHEAIEFGSMRGRLENRLSSRHGLLLPGTANEDMPPIANDKRRFLSRNVADCL
jgi:hypothetical protein